MICWCCDNQGWVCENHADKPWSGTSDREDACDCGGAGMPCECNTAHPPWNFNPLERADEVKTGVIPDLVTIAGTRQSTGEMKC